MREADQHTTKTTTMFAGQSDLAVPGTGFSILGIDAAWTEANPSGVALVSQTSGARWKLEAVTSSYAEFMVLSGHGRVPLTQSKGGFPDLKTLLEAADAITGTRPKLIAVDMPLSSKPIIGRRAADDLVSRIYGARKCSTHTPSAFRPGKISDNLRSEAERLGYTLATTAIGRLSLMEVYPHPALVELANAPERLPYKVAKARKYWPTLPAPERQLKLREVWAAISAHLSGWIEGMELFDARLAMALRPSELKAAEDALDAIVCCWIGICAVEGRAQPFGDIDAAIWILQDV